MCWRYTYIYIVFMSVCVFVCVFVIDLQIFAQTFHPPNWRLRLVREVVLVAKRTGGVLE